MDGEYFLVAEDNENDAFLMKHVLTGINLLPKARFVSDGKEAIDYLEGRGKFADRAQHPLPKILVLDLKMPVMDGFDVLDWLRNKSYLRRLPVVVFTTSNRKEDINRAYDLGANSYLVKPMDVGDLESLVAKLKSFWLEANQFPDCGPMI